MLRIDPTTARVAVASLQAVNRREHEPALVDIHMPVLPDIQNLHQVGPLRPFPQLRSAAHLAANFSTHFESGKSALAHSHAFQRLQREIEPRTQFLPWWIRQPLAKVLGGPSSQQQ